jgi:anti-sigma factor RsiW
MTELTCTSGVELLADYLDGALPADVSAVIDTHVTACSRCRAFIESYRATPQVVRHATAIEMPAELEASLRDVLRGRIAGLPPRD